VPGTAPDVPEGAGALPMAARLPTFAAGVAVEAAGERVIIAAMAESMRWVRAVCLLGLAACGYPPLPIPDAPPDIIFTPHVVLTWQLATTSPSGAPSAMLEYPPFAPGAAPLIRIATLDGPFAMASYSSDAATPGWIQVPRSYFEPSGDAPTAAPWRLEYTLPGGVPHEVQWAPEDRIGRLVVPMVGRV